MEPRHTETRKCLAGIRGRCCAIGNQDSQGEAMRHLLEVLLLGGGEHAAVD